MNSRLILISIIFSIPFFSYSSSTPNTFILDSIIIQFNNQPTGTFYFTGYCSTLKKCYEEQSGADPRRISWDPINDRWTIRSISGSPILISSSYADSDAPPCDLIHWIDGSSQVTFVDKACERTDQDGDGILDVYEDVDGDGMLDDDDHDMDGTPDYKDPDDDNDMILTKDELADPNTDGNPDDAINSDTDAFPDYLDNNDDNDQILTIYERNNGDTDGDGLPNHRDDDDDGDNILTDLENPDFNGDGNDFDAADSDSDGNPDYMDMDSDNDGLLDNAEDRNFNGILDQIESDPYSEDTDGDGISDALEDTNADGNPSNDDLDGDSLPNARDTDSDSDNISDGDEDINGNGIIEPNETNPYNADSDDDGIFDNYETGKDTDGDGRVNGNDLDDDNDGIITADESPDPDGNGNPSDAVDSDYDGIPDYLDNVQDEYLLFIIYSSILDVNAEIGMQKNNQLDNTGRFSYASGDGYECYWNNTSQRWELYYLASFLVAYSDVATLPSPPCFDFGNWQLEVQNGDQILDISGIEEEYPCSDLDLDGINNFLDNCPTASNPGQEDADGDGQGDPCDYKTESSIGINTDTPATDFHIKDLQVYIDNPYKGILMKGQDGNCYRLTIDAQGKLLNTMVDCPENSGM